MKKIDISDLKTAIITSYLIIPATVIGLPETLKIGTYVRFWAAIWRAPEHTKIHYGYFLRAGCSFVVNTTLFFGF